jgi:hypothetical protein
VANLAQTLIVRHEGELQFVVSRSEDGKTSSPMLRPPTFGALQEQLNSHPGHYHTVHFDGHGGYGEGELFAQCSNQGRQFLLQR